MQKEDQASDIFSVKRLIKILETKSLRHTLQESLNYEPTRKEILPDQLHTKSKEAEVRSMFDAELNHSSKLRRN